MSRRAKLAEVTAGTLAGTLAVLIGGPVPVLAAPDETLVNDEIVVAQLDARGLPIRSDLISRVTSNGGEVRTIVDPGSTANVEYLNQRGRAQVTGSGVELEVGGALTRTVITKALIDKPMPVAMHAQYTLDGDIVDPEVVVGADGGITVTYTVTNTDVERQRVTYRNAAGQRTIKQLPVFAPLVGTLVATLPPTFDPTETAGATVATDDHGNTLLTWNLVLFPPLGDYEQSVSFSATTTSGSVPGTVLTAMPISGDQDPGLAFVDDLLSGSVEGNEQLAAGLAQLDDSTVVLAGGAAELADGINALFQGADRLASGVRDEFVPGTERLAGGARGLASGQAQLTEALDRATEGARQLDSGAARLTTGLTWLAEGLDRLADDGLPQLAEGAARLRDGALLLAATLGAPDGAPLPLPTPPVPAAPTPIPTPSGSPVFPPASTRPPAPPPTLLQILDASVSAMATLADQAVRLNNNLVALDQRLVGVGTGIDSAGASADASATEIEALVADLCPPAGPLTPAQCDDLTLAGADARNAQRQADDAGEGLRAALSDADRESIRAYVIAWSSTQVQGALVALQAGLARVSVGLSNGDPPPLGLVQGLDELIDGLDLLISASDALAHGATEASDGGHLVASGNEQLASGLAGAASGSEALAEGGDQLAEGTADLSDGAAEVAIAMAGLATGAQGARDGAAELAAGADRIAREGTARIYRSVVRASDDPALANAYLAAAQDRAETALPYGLPEGATGNAAYLMTMAPVTASNTAAWGMAALVVLGAAALGGAALKALGESRDSR